MRGYRASEKDTLETQNHINNGEKYTTRGSKGGMQMEAEPETNGSERDRAVKAERVSDEAKAVELCESVFLYYPSTKILNW